MNYTSNQPAPSSTDVKDDQLVSLLYDLTRDSASDEVALETIDAIVYQRLLQTYGDDATAPLDA